MLWTAHDQKSSIKLFNLKDNVKMPFHRWHINVLIGARRRFGASQNSLCGSDLRCASYVTIVSCAFELDVERVLRLQSDAILRQFVIRVRKEVGEREREHARKELLC